MTTNPPDFRRQDWHSISLASGKSVNLTGELGVAFHDEQDDHPMRPGSHGLAGWTAGDRHVLIQDRFDLWQVSPDRSGAMNLTRGAGR